MKNSSFNLILVVAFINFLFVACNSEKAEINYETISCDAENLSKDSSSYISSNKFGSLFGNGRNISSEKAHSGKYSALTNTKRPYAFTYTINNVIAKDSFNIEVWRHASIAKASIVVSAEQADKFYVSQSASAQKDENGWELLTVNVVVPEAINKQNLKVYVWNPDTTEVAYFDDLKIQYLNKPKANN